MAKPNDPSARPPAVAGRFYPADAEACRAEAQHYLDLARPTASAEMPGAWTGGIVPHAGWVCSAAIAARTLAAIAATHPNPDVVVVFGAVHTPVRGVDFAALDSHARWSFPTSDISLPQDLQAHLVTKGNLFRVEPRLHAHEHAVEVEVPLIQLAFPNATILPVEVPAIDVAPLIGRKAAQTLARQDVTAVYLASSDLTHYGPGYGYAPVGVGPAAMRWTKDNDRRLLDLALARDPGAIVPESEQRLNACGAGAIAAMLAACNELGATRASLLSHATSYETLRDVAPQPPTNAVGYAALVVG